MEFKRKTQRLWCVVSTESGYACAMCETYKEALWHHKRTAGTIIEERVYYID